MILIDPHLEKKHQYFSKGPVTSIGSVQMCRFESLNAIIHAYFIHIYDIFLKCHAKHSVD